MRDDGLCAENCIGAFDEEADAVRWMVDWLTENRRWIASAIVGVTGSVVDRVGPMEISIRAPSSRRHCECRER